INILRNKKKLTKCKIYKNTAIVRIDVYTLVQYINIAIFQFISKHCNKTLLWLLLSCFYANQRLTNQRLARVSLRSSEVDLVRDFEHQLLVRGLRQRLSACVRLRDSSRGKSRALWGNGRLKGALTAEL